MLAPLLDIRAVAAFRGVHVDTVRKGWRRWVREQGFPAPTPKPYRWDPAALQAWSDSTARGALFGRDTTKSDAPANENGPPAPGVAVPPRHVERQRDAILMLMRG